MKWSLILLLYLIISTPVKSQNKLPGIYLNHIFVVLDSVTYNNLFDSVFIKQSFGDTYESTVSTTGDTWSGKYLYGLNGYIEFFSTSGLKGSAVGDFGLGFMTGKAGDIWEIEKNWDNLSTDSIYIDTMKYNINGSPHPWFYSIGHIPENNSISDAWLMENTPEELLHRGYTGDEIKNPISWQNYMAKVNKKEFSKSFSSISSVFLDINGKEIEFLRKSLLGFGLTEKENCFFNYDIKIFFNITQNTSSKVRSIEIELTESIEDRRILISNFLRIELTGNKAIWNFWE